MAQLIISVSGLRGIVGETLTPREAINYSGAFAAGLPENGRVVLTRDGRASGEMLAQAISSALRAAGLDVLYGDVAATPTTGILVREHDAVAGIQVSASHNPAPYNGIKLFGPDGRVISAAAGSKVLQRYLANEARTTSHDRLGSWTVLTDTTSLHLEKVLSTVNVSAIRQCKFHVLLDSNHGAGSVLGSLLLNALGCQVTPIGAVPDGQFEHLPEPTAANLQSVAAYAARTSANVVFCQDPDADRLAIIDENGRYIGEEFTLALVLEHALANASRPGTIVTNCSTSRMAEDIAQKHNCKLVLSAVGEANVTDAMMGEKAIYGGEGNGGPIDPRVGYVRDSFVGMAQVLDFMAARRLPISKLVAELPQYEICKSTISIDRENIPDLFNRLACEFAEAKPSRLDGLRLDWPDRWLLVRASNTEPIIRAVAEAKSKQAAIELCEATARAAQQLLATKSTP